MVYEFKFPDIGEGITEGVIVKWLVKVGDKVKADQKIAAIETDKAVVDIPCPKSGIIHKINYKVGKTIKVGEVLVEIDEGGKTTSKTPIAKKTKPAKVSKQKPLKKTSTKKAPVKKSIVKPKVSKIKSAKKSASPKHYTGSVIGVLDEKVTEIPSEITSKTTKSAGKKVRATLRIRVLAKKLGIDLDSVKGTGNSGRITEDDLKSAGKSTSVKSGKTQIVPISGLRKTIAKKLTQANTIQVPVTNFYDCDCTKLWDLRNKEKIKAEKKGIKLTFMPYIIKAVLNAMKSYPVLNSSIEDDNLVIKKFYNIGFAVATDDGLIVPNIKDADKKSLYDLAKEIVELANKARARTLRLDEIKNSTFSITNLGSIGVKYFTPMLNYPEAAILGLGKIEERAVVIKSKIVIKRILPLSLTYDHRSVDGATASMFMLKIIEKIEKAEF